MQTGTGTHNILTCPPAAPHHDATVTPGARPADGIDELLGCLACSTVDSKKLPCTYLLGHCDGLASWQQQKFSALRSSMQRVEDAGAADVETALKVVVGGLGHAQQVHGELGAPLAKAMPCGKVSAPEALPLHSYSTKSREVTDASSSQDAWRPMRDCPDMEAGMAVMLQYGFSDFHAHRALARAWSSVPTAMVWAMLYEKMESPSESDFLQAQMDMAAQIQSMMHQYDIDEDAAREGIIMCRMDSDKDAAVRYAVSKTMAKMNRAQKNASMLKTQVAGVKHLADTLQNTFVPIVQALDRAPQHVLGRPYPQTLPVPLVSGFSKTSGSDDLLPQLFSAQKGSEVEELVALYGFQIEVVRKAWKKGRADKGSASLWSILFEQGEASTVNFQRALQQLDSNIVALEKFRFSKDNAFKGTIMARLDPCDAPLCAFLFETEGSCSKEDLEQARVDMANGIKNVADSWDLDEEVARKAMILARMDEEKADSVIEKCYSKGAKDEAAARAAALARELLGIKLDDAEQQSVPAADSSNKSDVARRPGNPSTSLAQNSATHIKSLMRTTTAAAAGAVSSVPALPAAHKQSTSPPLSPGYVDLDNVVPQYGPISSPPRQSAWSMPQRTSVKSTGSGYSLLGDLWTAEDDKNHWRK